MSGAPPRARTPSISVVIAAHDGERYLQAAIDSVLAQTLTDFELIVVDDRSTDGTAEIVERAAAADERVRLVKIAEGSAGAARNAGWRASSTPYVAVLDQDDTAEPTRLERQVAHLDANPELAAVGGHCRILDERGRHRGVLRVACDPDEVARRLRVGESIIHPTATMRREAVEGVGGYRELPGTACEDYDLFLRLSERHPVANLPEVLGGWRLHDANSSARTEAGARWLLAVRAAARLRREGRPDPLATWMPAGAPSNDELARLGVDAAAVRAATVDGHLGRASLCLTAGQPDAARIHLDRARSLGDHDDLASLARILLGLARVERAEGRPTRAGVRLLLGGVVAPGVVLPLAMHALAGAFGRTVYRRLPAGGGRAGRRLRGLLVARLNRLG